MKAAKGPRDTLVTGMGFCLPGRDGRTSTPEQFWEAISQGDSFLEQDDGVYFGRVRIDAKEVAERLPEMPESFLAKYSEQHLYGLFALLEAADDAGLDWRAGEMSEAAVLAGRNPTSDAIVDTYLPVLLADTDALSQREARSIIFRNVLNGVMSDVETSQVGLLRSTGPSYTLSCGCASSSVLFGNVSHMIASGEVDMAVITGADYWRENRLRQYVAVEQRSLDGLVPQAQTLFNIPMRPYDQRACGLNYANGAATVIVESREHAERRGAKVWGRVLSHALRRNAQSNLALDLEGKAAVRAIESCLEGWASPDEIDYVNGMASGDQSFNLLESNIASGVFGDRAARMPVTSQEAVFGHSGAPLGTIGVAATLQMMAHGQIAPTANCEKPADVCTFDPVPGTTPRPARIERALNLNGTIGSIASVTLLGGADD